MTTTVITNRDVDSIKSLCLLLCLVSQIIIARSLHNLPITEKERNMAFKRSTPENKTKLFPSLVNHSFEFFSLLPSTRTRRRPSLDSSLLLTQKMRKHLQHCYEQIYSRDDEEKMERAESERLLLWQQLRQDLECPMSPNDTGKCGNKLVTQKPSTVCCSSPPPRSPPPPPTLLFRRRMTMPNTQPLLPQPVKNVATTSRSTTPPCSSDPTKNTNYTNVKSRKLDRKGNDNSMILSSDFQSTLDANEKQQRRGRKRKLNS